MLLVGEDTGRTQGCYGDPLARTPALDHLAAEGVRYSHAFSTCPVCAPSRSTLVTGKYAFSIGTHHMRSTLKNPPRLFTEELREGGYFVNWSNKTDFNFDPPESFSDAASDWTQDLASGKSRGRPWFLYRNFETTHESFMWPEKWEEKVRPHLHEDEICDPARVIIPSYLPDTPEVRADIARYYDSQTLLDRQVGEVLQALDQSGERDRTIVIFLSDHGRGLPREKRWCYDAGIHLPLIIRWPGVTEPGKVDDRLVSWIDIAPTVLGMAGVSIPEDYQGRCFLGDHAKKPERSYCFAGRDRMDEAFDRVRVARDQYYLYIRNDFPEIPYAQRIEYMEKQNTTRILREWGARGKLEASQLQWLREVKPAEELYDTRVDPDCVNNLVGNSNYENTRITMRNALEAELQRVGDLGELPEAALIEEGMVEDRLKEYRNRIRSLPSHLQGGAQPAFLEMPGFVKG